MKSCTPHSDPNFERNCTRHPINNSDGYSRPTTKTVYQGIIHMGLNKVMPSYTVREEPPPRVSRTYLAPKVPPLSYLIYVNTARMYLPYVHNILCQYQSIAMPRGNRLCSNSMLLRPNAIHSNDSFEIERRKKIGTPFEMPGRTRRFRGEEGIFDPRLQYLISTA